jgi:Arc/MetJ-type ribon-helix-helix transcriptional regulator
MKAENLAEIVQPLVEKGLFENAESAVRNLLSDFVFQQVKQHRSVVRKFEKKYGMNYSQFTKYLEARTKKLAENPALHQSIMLEEEDGLDWKIAYEMLESWLGLKEKNACVQVGQQRTFSRFKHISSSLSYDERHRN